MTAALLRLRDVVDHYDSCFSLGLADQDKTDMVEFLKSLPATKPGAKEQD